MPSNKEHIKTITTTLVQYGVNSTTENTNAHHQTTISKIMETKRINGVNSHIWRRN
jgi:hypothetical protein